MVAYVGRLDEQKGMHLVHHALFCSLAHGGQFVLLGDSNHHNGINGHFRHLKHFLYDSPDCNFYWARHGCPAATPTSTRPRPYCPASSVSARNRTKGQSPAPGRLRCQLPDK